MSCIWVYCSSITIHHFLNMESYLLTAPARNHAAVIFSHLLWISIDRFSFYPDITSITGILQVTDTQGEEIYTKHCGNTQRELDIYIFMATFQSVRKFMFKPNTVMDLLD